METQCSTPPHGQVLWVQLLMPHATAWLPCHCCTNVTKFHRRWQPGKVTCTCHLLPGGTQHHMCHAATSGLGTSELGLAAVHVRDRADLLPSRQFGEMLFTGSQAEVPKGPLREQGADSGPELSLGVRQVWDSFGEHRKDCAGSLLKARWGVEEGGLGPLLGVGGCGVCCRNMGRPPPLTPCRLLHLQD